MKLSNMLKETFECVKINGILRNLTNNEMKIYKKVKDEGKVFKSDLSEFDANVATSMVTKGLLRRIKAKQENGKHGRIYFITRGRKGNLVSKQLDEVAPPDKKIESWIKKNKKRFKDRYGKGYEKYLYGKAWNNYNGKLKESANDDDSKIDYTVYVDTSMSEDSIKNAYNTVSKIHEFMESKYSELKNITSSDRYIHTLKKKAYDDIIKKLCDEDFFSWNNDITDVFELKNEYGGEFTIYEEYAEPLSNHIRENAFDSGDYNEYGEAEYNSDATWDSINDYDTYELIDEYTGDDDKDNFLNNMLNYIEKIIEILNSSVVEIPEWNGDYNNINTISKEEIENKRKEAIINIKNRFAELFEIKEKINNILANGDSIDTRTLSELRDFAYDYLDRYNTYSDIITEETYNAIRDKFRKMNMSFDTLYDSARDGAQESGDFDVYYDAEIDNDATWDSVDRDSIIDWLTHVGYDTETYNDVYEIYKLFSEIIRTYNSESDDEIPSGEEFNESVLL